jgi:HK97 family phage portal protein
MSIFQLAQKSFAGGRVPVLGNIGRSRSLNSLRLASTGFDYAYEAGKIYDNAIVLPAINKKANTISECQLVIQQSTPKGWKEAKSIAAAQCLATILQPNEYYGGGSLMRGTVLSWDVRGQSFWIKRRDRMGRLLGFYWIPHHRIQAASERDNADATKLITNYWYQPFGTQQFDVDPEDVVHFRCGIDPEDPRCGLSPLAAALRDVCTENEASNWLASILRNGGAPSSFVVPKAIKDVPAPTPDQLTKVKQYVNEFVRDKRGEVAALPVPVEIISPVFNPQQMEIGKLREIPTSRICAALGGDPMVFGLPSESKTYSNLAEALDAFGKQTILPMLREWAEQMGRQILPEFGLDPGQYRFYWDTKEVSWLQDETDDLHNRLRENFKVGAYDLFRYRELLGEIPSPADRGVTYFDLSLGASGATTDPKAISPQAAKQVRDNLRRLKALGRAPATLKRAGTPNSAQGKHDDLIRATREKIDRLTHTLADGGIDGDTFREELGNILADAHAKSYAVGIRSAGGTITADEAAATGQRIADLESAFIDGFVHDLTTGRYDGDAGIDFENGLLQQRIDLYAQKVSSTATSGFVDGSDDTAEFAWDLGKVEDHCQDCPYLAENSPYDKSTLYTTPRAGDTPCLGNCTCTLRRNDGLAAFAPVTL